MKKDSISRYLIKHALKIDADDQLSMPSPDLKLCIVIPSLAETGCIEKTLASLLIDYNRLGEVEVIVVVNNARNASEEIIINNLETIALLKKNWGDKKLPVFYLDRATGDKGLAPDQAGVGLARRIGMDAALTRLQQAGNSRHGSIACLDADATVKSGYIDALLNIFGRTDQPFGGICAFEHPLPDDPELKEGIIYYELWLRYLELGLILSGSLFAYQSIGSCMIVSAKAYAMADGMPLRQAAEDFHFLQKVTKISRFQGLMKIRETVVYPEARYSDRVLFGTGRAMNRIQEEESFYYRQVANPKLFQELKGFIKLFEDTSLSIRGMKNQVGYLIGKFMDDEKGWDVFERLQQNYKSDAQLTIAYHHWFDGLKIIRFLNRYAVDKIDINTALPQMLKALEYKFEIEIEKEDTIKNAMTWLNLLRHHW